MAIDLNKNEKNLNQYIDYVNNQINYTGEELKIDLAQRGLSEDEIDYVMAFYKPHIKQKMFSHPFSFHGRIRRLEYGLSVVLVYIYSFFIVFISELMGEESATLLSLILIIPLYWFMWAQGANDVMTEEIQDGIS